METKDAWVTYSLQHNKIGKMGTCKRQATAEHSDGVHEEARNMFQQTVWWGYTGQSGGAKQEAEGAVQRATPRPRNPCQSCRPWRKRLVEEGRGHGPVSQSQSPGNWTYAPV